MKKITRHIRIATLTVAIMFMSLVMVAACLAGSLVSVHGHSGDIQHMDRIYSSSPKMGWGLDFIQKPGTYNWIHYSIPTVPFTKTRYLLVYYETGETGEATDIKITELHVWDGNKRIYRDTSVNLTGGPDYVIIDMGEDKTISWGLGLSIGIGAGVENMSHRMRIYAVMAEWH